MNELIIMNKEASPSIGCHTVIDPPGVPKCSTVVAFPENLGSLQKWTSHTVHTIHSLMRLDNPQGCFERVPRQDTCVLGRETIE